MRFAYMLLIWNGNDISSLWGDSVEFEARQRDEYLEMVLTGDVDIYEGVQRFAQFANWSQMVSRQRMLIDYRQLRGEVSRTQDCIFGESIGKSYADYLQGGGSPFRLALLGPPSLVDPDSPATRLAAVYGLEMAVFTDRQAAVDWLLGPEVNEEGGE